MTIYERKLELERTIRSYIDYLFSEEIEQSERDRLIFEIGELKSELNRLNETPMHLANQKIKRHSEIFESKMNK